MNLQQWILAPDPNEQPLDHLVHDGGYCGIFRTFGFLGDSLTSGEFEAKDSEGQTHYMDFYDYSWGQHLARMAGCRGTNFSGGGMTAKLFLEKYGEHCHCFDSENACSAYILALGVNDLIIKRWPLGTMQDALQDPVGEDPTFSTNYAAIIRRLQAQSPQSKFFLVTMPRQDNDSAENIALRDAHAALMYEFAEHFSNTYVIDLRKYAPVYDADFRERFYMNNHLNAAGYLLTAQMIASYIDYIVRHNIRDFREIGLFGTPYTEKQESQP